MKTHDPSKRVLITGVTGFTGRLLFARLRAHNVHVIGLSRNGGEGHHSLDMHNASDLRCLLRDYDPTHIVHFAAQAHPGHPDVIEIYDSNITLVLNLCASLSDARSLRQVIIPSSAAVYGGIDGNEVLSEESDISIHTHYANAKYCVENMIGIYANTLPILIVRPFNYIGVGQRDIFFVPKVVRAHLQRERVLHLGRLDIVRDFSDVRDVVEAYARLIETTIVGHTLNICSGNGTSLTELIQIVAKLTGHHAAIEMDQSFIRQNDPLYLVGSEKKLIETIGTREKYSLKETLRWIIANEEVASINFAQRPESPV